MERMTNQSVEKYNYHTWANQTILGRIKELPMAPTTEAILRTCCASWPRFNHDRLLAFWNQGTPMPG